MIAAIALCIPPLFLLCIRNKVLGIHRSVKGLILSYLASFAVVNWFMMMLLFYVIHSYGYILSKLNTYHQFARNYTILSLFISIAEPFAELLIRKLLNKPADPDPDLPIKKRSILTKQDLIPSTALLYCLFLLLMILTIFNKENYHVDEMYSYGLSNHQRGIVIRFEEGKKYTSPEEPYMEYMTVDKDHRFDYENVWENQTHDVHPPFYYAILHTICSFFAGKFSKWYAGSINIVFGLLTLFALRKLIRSITGNNEGICTLLSIAFIFSSGVLSSISFLRMYILTMFLVTLLTYLFVDEVGRWEFDLHFYLKLFFIAVTGALTHYYCMIYTVLLCIVYCLMLLGMKKWLPVGKFIVTGVLAGGTANMLFPQMIEQMFYGYRGTEALDNLQQSSYEYWTKIRQYFDIFDKDVFGNIAGYILVGLIFVLIIQCIAVTKQSRSERISGRLLAAFDADRDVATTAAIRYGLILTTSALYFLFVAKAAPYIADRYLFPVYAVAFAGLTCLSITILQSVYKTKTMFLVIALMLSVIVVGEWKNSAWNYLYKPSVKLLEEAKNYKDVDCLYIYNAEWRAQPSFLEVRNYRSVTFVQADHLKDISSLEIADQDKLIVMIIPDKKKNMEKIMKICPQLTKYSEVGRHGFSTTYYAFSKQAYQR